MRKHLVLLPILLVSTAPIFSLSSCGEPVATKIELNKTELTLKEDSSEQLIAIIYPAGATDEINWLSDNKSVATVNDGLVEAHGIGTATITATLAHSGLTATCSVNVESKYADHSLDRIQFDTFYVYRTRSFHYAKDEYHKFYIDNFVEGGNVRLAFSSGGIPPHYMDEWIIDKLVINKTETTEFVTKLTDCWALEFAAPAESRIEIYLQATNTIGETDIARGIVNWEGPW